MASWLGMGASTDRGTDGNAARCTIASTSPARSSRGRRGWIRGRSHTARRRGCVRHRSTGRPPRPRQPLIRDTVRSHPQTSRPPVTRPHVPAFHVSTPPKPAVPGRLRLRRAPRSAPQVADQHLLHLAELFVSHRDLDGTVIPRSKMRSDVPSNVALAPTHTGWRCMGFHTGLLSIPFRSKAARRSAAVHFCLQRDRPPARLQPCCPRRRGPRRESAPLGDRRPANGSGLAIACVVPSSRRAG